MAGRPLQVLRRERETMSKMTTDRVMTHVMGAVCEDCGEVLEPDACECGRPHGFYEVSGALYPEHTHRHTAA